MLSFFKQGDRQAQGNFLQSHDDMGKQRETAARGVEGGDDARIGIEHETFKEGRGEEKDKMRMRMRMRMRRREHLVEGVDMHRLRLGVSTRKGVEVLAACRLLLLL